MKANVFAMPMLNRFVLLFFATFIYRSLIAGATNTGNNSNDVIYQRDVSIDGTVIGTLQILYGEEPADVVFQFGRQHGLDDRLRKSILDDLCLRLTCGRDHAIILKIPVVRGAEGNVVGVFELPESTEPVDIAEEFVSAHGLGKGYRDDIVRRACEIVNCTRINPLVWKKSVLIDNNKKINIEVEEGQEPADAIFSSLKPFNVPRSQRKIIMEEAKKENVPYSREDALVFAQNILMDNETSYLFELFDNEIEPIDVLYKFAKDHNLENYWGQLVDSVHTISCQYVLCSRTNPLLWSMPIKSTTGTTLATVAVYKDQEPADAIDYFCQVNSLNINYRDHLVAAACEELNCTRRAPVVYRKHIKGENEIDIGAVEILEGEEVIDGVVRFLRSKRSATLGMDEIQLKNYFFQEACTNPRVRCTRNVAIVYDNRISDENGAEIARLTLTEYEEPADAVFAWCQKQELPYNVYSNLLEEICKNEMVICNRKAPLIFGPQQITGPDGNVVGILEIELFQEPVDALYGFFAKYRLFEKDWNMLAVLDQICTLPALQGKCQRRKAVKYLNETFEIGGVETGPLVIWEDEEVIDKLYDLRMKHNVSLESQMMRFQEICSNDKVRCGRTKAVIYRRSNINLKDYEIFGNETCARQYAGWKYLAGITSTKIGSKVVEYIKEERIESVIKHPVTCPLLFWASTLFILVSYFLFQRQSAKSLCQRVVFVVIVFLVVACLQVCVTEPFDNIDSAYYVYEGALPDLTVLEGEEPVDSIMAWAKEMAKEHHPIVRQPIHISLVEETCARVTCNRLRAWEKIDFGSFHYFGTEYKLSHMNPSHWDDKSKAASKIDETITGICGRLFPPFNDCHQTLSDHLAKELAAFNKYRLDMKSAYTKIGVEMDIPGRELFERHAAQVRQFGFNISPYARVDNGTATYPSWDIHTTSAYCLKDAFYKVRDPENRLWNDKPCKPMFNGALCAKTDKDGNMIIEA